MNSKNLKVIISSNELTTLEQKNELVLNNERISAIVQKSTNSIEEFKKIKEDYEKSNFISKWFKKDCLEKANLDLTAALGEIAKVSLFLNAQSLSNSIEIKNIQEFFLKQQNETIEHIQNLKILQNDINEQVKAIQASESEINQTIISKFEGLENKYLNLKNHIDNLQKKTNDIFLEINNQIKEDQTNANLKFAEIETEFNSNINTFKFKHDKQIRDLIQKSKNNRFAYFIIATVSVSSFSCCIWLLYKQLSQ